MDGRRAPRSHQAGAGAVGDEGFTAARCFESSGWDPALTTTAQASTSRRGAPGRSLAPDAWKTAQRHQNPLARGRHDRLGERGERLLAPCACKDRNPWRDGEPGFRNHFLPWRLDDSARPKGWFDID